MSDCYNILCLSGDRSEISEFLSLIFYRDKSGNSLNNVHDYIDCGGLLSKAKRSKNTEVIEVIREELLEEGVIGCGAYYEDECLYYTTRNGPTTKSLLYISNLFPNVNFELLWDSPDEEVEGTYEFQDGHLLTDFSVEKEEKGWTLNVLKTKFRNIINFKRNYKLSRLRNVKVEGCLKFVY